jgi:hypothetical protein
MRVQDDSLVVDLAEAPPGTTLAVLPPGGDGTWRQVTTMEEVR